MGLPSGQECILGLHLYHSNVHTYIRTYREATERETRKEREEPWAKSGRERKGARKRPRELLGNQKDKGKQKSHVEGRVT